MRDAIGNLPRLDPFITDVDEKELLEIVPHYYERAEQAKKYQSGIHRHII